jgi:PhnB protein
MPQSKIPEGYHTITPTLTVDGAAEAIALYTEAFGAKEEYRVPQTDNSGKIMHACLQIGTSKIFLADTSEKMGCSTPSKSTFYLYVDDADATVAQAKKAGMSEKMAPEDMFWGDRMGSVTDKFGNIWTIATHVRDVSEGEMQQAMEKMRSKAA